MTADEQKSEKKKGKLNIIEIEKSLESKEGASKAEIKVVRVETNQTEDNADKEIENKEDTNQLMNIKVCHFSSEFCQFYITIIL